MCRQAFSVGPAQLVEWQAYFQLDDALLGTRSSLDSACQSLPGDICYCLHFLAHHVLPKLKARQPRFTVSSSRSSLTSACQSLSGQPSTLQCCYGGPVAMYQLAHLVLPHSFPANIKCSRGSQSPCVLQLL